MLSPILLSWTIIITVVIIILAIPILLINLLFKLNNINQLIVRIWGKLILIFHKIEVIGENNILKNRSQIIFANHQSNFDIFLFSAILKVPFSWMAKDSLFRIPIFGWVIKTLGYIPVKRGSMKVAKAIEVAKEKLKNNQNIIIFPEGTWSNSDNLLPFKSGIYYLSKQTKVPLLPVNICGSNKVNPPDSYRVYLKPLKVIIHPPIFSNEYIDKDKNSFLNHIRSILKYTNDNLTIK